MSDLLSQDCKTRYSKCFSSKITEEFNSRPLSCPESRGWVKEYVNRVYIASLHVNGFYR